MKNKSARFYFENYISAAELICGEALYLKKSFDSYRYEELNKMIVEIHKFEHSADDRKHEMSAALAKAFVTPIDREDLAALSQNIDNVADKLEEILQRFYIHGIKRILPDASLFVRKIEACCSLMKDMITEFPNFKKSSELKKLIIEVSNTEEECDKLYLDSCARVQDECTDVLEILAWREIFDYMENCVDACEDVADCIETIVMKNT